MKTTHLVLLTGFIICLCTALRAQVKIGDNPLQISDNRLLEIESGSEYFLVKDSSGMTIGRADASNDPLMLKLFGYGISPTSLFAPGGSNGNQDYFLGTNSNGEVLEFPLSLDLNNSTNIGELSFNNGDILFGSVQLDSVFATNTQLSDSVSTIRTLVSSSEASDGDTITGNEWIRQIGIGESGAREDGAPGNYSETELIFRENINPTASDPQHVRAVDLDPIYTTDIDLDTNITNVRNELADTAAVLRDFNFYLNDNAFDDPSRTASGGGVTNLTFDSLSEFNVINSPIINLNSDIGDVSLTSDDANINLNSTSGNTVITTSGFGVSGSGNSNIDITGTSTLRSDALNSIESTTNILVTAGDTINIEANDNISVDGNVQLDDYGMGNKTGSESYLIGVDGSGNLVDVDLDSIGGDAVLSSPVDLDEDGTEETTVDEAIQASNREIDSTIYNYDGILTGNRNLDGNSLNLTFDNLGTYTLSNTTTYNIATTTATVDIDAPTVDLDGTTYTADYTTSNITTTGDNTIESNGADVQIISTDSIATQSTNTAINATNNITLSANTAIGSEAPDVSILASNTTTVSGDNSNTITSSSGNVDINAFTNVEISAGDTVNINGTDNVSIDGNVQLDDYGMGNKTGSESYLIGVDGSGNLVDVDLDSIGGDAVLSSPVDLDEDGTEETTVDEAIQASNREIDSTIYNYNGILQGMRTMDMNNFNLYFVSADDSDTTVITNDGKMAIGKGTVTPATMAGREIKLDVNGDILAMQVHSSSDRRFKKNIETVHSALEKVQSLRGVNYDFRIDEFKNRDFPQERQLGFIAQEVEEVIPEVVKTAGDGYKSVDYSKITALLTQAIKEQQAIIDGQNLKIAKQEQNIELQANLINQLTEQTSKIIELIESKELTTSKTDISEE